MRFSHTMCFLSIDHLSYQLFSLNYQDFNFEPLSVRLFHIKKRKISTPSRTSVYLIFRLFIRNRITRGRAIIDFFYRFVFANPPWEREITEDSGENYRFLLKTCPFSDVFRLHESPHLCSKVLCYFDVYMADKWKVAFTRPITLVEGGPIATLYTIWQRLHLEILHRNKLIHERRFLPPTMALRLARLLIIRQISG